MSSYKSFSFFGKNLIVYAEFLYFYNYYVGLNLLHKFITKVKEGKVHVNPEELDHFLYTVTILVDIYNDEKETFLKAIKTKCENNESVSRQFMLSLILQSNIGKLLLKEEYNITRMQLIADFLINLNHTIIKNILFTVMIIDILLHPVD